MKIQCICNHLIVDQEEFSYKGHILPDTEWFNFLNTIDEAVERSGPSPDDKEAAIMKVRSMASRLTKTAYQCAACGRLYLHDETGKLHEYTPASVSTSKKILRS